MKKMCFLIMTFYALSGCNSSSNEEQEIWQGVFFDYDIQSYVHDPEYNFSLVFENNEVVKVIQPSIDLGYVVESIEIISETEMDIAWKIPDNRIVRTQYRYDDEGKLLLDPFAYTVAAVPFPSNLVEGVFVQKIKVEN